MSYLKNPRQYVEDLSNAAEAEDWETYQRVQSQLAVESTLSALQQVQQAAQAAENNRKKALREAEVRHPGFSEKLDREKSILEKKRPKLAEAISMAEQRPDISESLEQLYESAYDFFNSQAGSPNRNTRGGDRHATQASLSTSNGRKNIIRSFEEQFGDIQIDHADTSNG
jgi:chromosome segregation ATPase